MQKVAENRLFTLVVDWVNENIASFVVYDESEAKVGEALFRFFPGFGFLQEVKVLFEGRKSPDFKDIFRIITREARMECIYRKVPTLIAQANEYSPLFQEEGFTFLGVPGMWFMKA